MFKLLSSFVQRAVSTTRTMAKYLMAMANLEQSAGARLVSSSKTYSVGRPRTYFRSIKRTGIEALMQRSGKKLLQGSCILLHLPSTHAVAAQVTTFIQC